MQTIKVGGGRTLCQIMNHVVHNVKISEFIFHFDFLRETNS